MSISTLRGFRRSRCAHAQPSRVNSKATLKVALEDVFSFVPSVLHPHIRASPYATSKSQSIVISSDDSRKQNDNTRSCFLKLHQLIMEAGRNSVPGETSAEQSKRVEGLAKAHNQARLREKKKMSTKKASRKGGSNDY